MKFKVGQRVQFNKNMAWIFRQGEIGTIVYVRPGMLPKHTDIGLLLDGQSQPFELDAKAYRDYLDVLEEVPA